MAARERGIEVELINMAIHEAMYAGLFAGQIDMIDATVDDMLPNYDPQRPQARYALGSTLQRLGRSAEAKEQLDEFQRLRAAAFQLVHSQAEHIRQATLAQLAQAR